MSILRGLGFLTATVLLYLGVPLLGWGLGDVGGFLISGPRAACAVIVALFGAAAGYQGITAPEGIRGGRGQQGKLVPRQTIVRAVVVCLLYLALFLLPFADRRGVAMMAEGQAVRWIGATLLGLGCGLIFWSGQPGGDHPGEPSADHGRGLPLCPSPALSGGDRLRLWSASALPLVGRSGREPDPPRHHPLSDQGRGSVDAHGIRPGVGEVLAPHVASHSLSLLALSAAVRRLPPLHRRLSDCPVPLPFTDTARQRPALPETCCATRNHQRARLQARGMSGAAA